LAAIWTVCAKRSAGNVVKTCGPRVCHANISNHAIYKCSRAIAAISILVAVRTALLLLDASVAVLERSIYLACALAPSYWRALPLWFNSSQCTKTYLWPQLKSEHHAMTNMGKYRSQIERAVTMSYMHVLSRFPAVKKAENRVMQAYIDLVTKKREKRWRERALPDFIIIGGMKCGTSSLFNYLGQHPQLFGSS